jgi:hypothetical protein
MRHRSDLPTNGISGGLPGRANATIRSPAAAGIRRQGPGSARRQRTLKALICRIYLTKAKRRYRDLPGRGETGVFAPFVYRLGRHPFTVERAVRFR